MMRSFDSSIISPATRVVESPSAGDVVDDRIEVIEQPGESIRQQVVNYLRASRATSGACFEHDPRWLNVLADGLGHRTFMLIARRGGGVVDPPTALAAPICGYLPLALVKTRLWGAYLVSLPYLNRAGVVAENAAQASVLVEAAVELARRLDVSHLELRHHTKALACDSLGVTQDQKVRMLLHLPRDVDYLWKRLNAKVRNQIRKGEKSGLTIHWGVHELLDDFYRVFSINMRDLGTPVYPKKLFAGMLDQFGAQAELAVVRRNGRPIASAMLLHDPHELGGLAQVPSASSLRRFSHTNANMWMYHHLLRRAIERGGETFDFGRSSVDSGTYRFKKQWGAEAHPTMWQYHIRRGDVGNVRPDNPKYRRRIAIWRRLPVWLTRLIGPRIIRGIP